jgi:hypothetical protein
VLIQFNFDHPAIKVVSAGAPVPLFGNVLDHAWTTNDDFPAFQHCPGLRRRIRPVVDQAIPEGPRRVAPLVSMTLLATSCVVRDGVAVTAAQLQGGELRRRMRRCLSRASI